MIAPSFQTVLISAITLAVFSCTTMVSVPDKPRAAESSGALNTAPLASTQLRSPAAVWTEERGGYSVRYTVPFTNAERFQNYWLAELSPALRRKIDLRPFKPESLSDFSNAVRKNNLQIPFQAAEGQIPIFGEPHQEKKNKSQSGKALIASWCLSALKGLSSNRIFLTVHGQITGSDLLPQAPFQKPSFSIKARVTIFLFDTHGEVLFLKHYSHETTGLKKEDRKLVASYYQALENCCRTNRGAMNGDLAEILSGVKENPEPQTNRP